MLEIQCAGEQLRLYPDKAVFWPRNRSLIVADLHLGKSAAFRKSGIAVPENTTATDLARLDRLLSETTATRLVILGDLFHASAGLQPEMLDAVFGWRQKNQLLQILLLTGNHDKHAGRPPESWDFEIAQSHLDPPFLFRHEPGEDSTGYVLSGHIHPAISLAQKFRGSIRAPCFCFGKRCGIFPAFGSFTGMKNLSPKPGDRIFAIGPGEVIPL